MIIIEASCGLGRQSIKASVPHRSFLRRERAEEAHVWASDQQRRAASQGADMLNMPSARVLINSSVREGKGNPAACLISEKPFLGTLISFCSSQGWFLCNNTGWKKKIKAIICQAIAIYNCKDKNQTAMISQRIELCEFMAACVIIIIKQMHIVKQWKKICLSPNLSVSSCSLFSRLTLVLYFLL